MCWGWNSRSPREIWRERRRNEKRDGICEAVVHAMIAEFGARYPEVKSFVVSSPLSGEAKAEYLRLHRDGLRMFKMKVER